MTGPRGVVAALFSLLVLVAATASPAASVTWPPSSGLVVAEVVTGGASASDEYVEIANAGPAAVDLGGLELVYVSASGATVTRKALFGSPLALEPGRHLLVANVSGAYATHADVTYAGGFAAEGGAIALRRADGTVVDAVGWGTATAFLEGTAAPAPPARSSIERLPGGSAGNLRDTNDNGTDFAIQPDPIAQDLACDPVPAPLVSPQETGTDQTSATPDSGDATAQPVPTEPASADGSCTPSPDLTADPSPGPTATASATAAPSSSGALMGDSSTPTPGPVVSIALARNAAIGARVHVTGFVTAATGVLGDDQLVSIADDTAGIFVRVDAATGIVAGEEIEVEGALADPYGQLEIRQPASRIVGSAGAEPEPRRIDLSDVGEATEGALVNIRGTVESVTNDSGHLTVTVGDGTTSVRVYAAPASGISGADVARGDVVAVTGIVGQRAGAKGRLDGYRVWTRSVADLIVRAPIVPDPTGTATATPRPSPSAGASAPVRDLVSAVHKKGAIVDVEAVVTAAAGLFEVDGPTIVVDDGTAAVAVVLPDGSVSPRVGAVVRVQGRVSSWQTGPIVRATAVLATGGSAGPQSVTVSSELGPELEWQLVRVYGRVAEATHAGTRWRLALLVGGRTVVVLGEPAAGPLAANAEGRSAAIAGIVRRSTSDSSVFQLLPRDPDDVRLGAPLSTPGTASGSDAGPALAGGTAADGEDGRTAASTRVPISELEARLGGRVTVAGIVTAAEVGEVAIEDGTGSVRVGGDAAAAQIDLLEPGDAIEVSGTVVRDGSSLLVVAEPGSVVVLPANGPLAAAAATAESAATPAWSFSLDGPTETPAGDRAARLSSGSGRPVDPVLALLVLAACLAAAGAAMAAHRRSRPAGRPESPLEPLESPETAPDGPPSEPA